MTYNVFIKTQLKSFNIFSISKDDLDIIVNAYNKGIKSFFIGGVKYWISDLFEIRIFEFPYSEKIEDFKKLAKAKNLFQSAYFGEEYLEPNVLKEGGKEVTRDYIKGDFGSQGGNNVIKKNKIEMDIFISHSSSDTEIAKALIDIIRKALNIKSNSIRCTSVPGYKLPAGASTDEQLRTEIISSKVFIGLITSSSITSTYVLFELGARWGMNLPLIPLICDKLGTSLLDGPIKNINALSALNASDLLQFLHDLSEALDVETENPSGYLDEIEKLKILITGEDRIETESKSVLEKDEFEDADDVIKRQSEIKWKDDYEMRLHYIEAQKKAINQLRKGKPVDLTEEEFIRIRERAAREWPMDYEMRLHEEEKQIESLRKLKSFE